MPSRLLDSTASYYCSSFIFLYQALFFDLLLILRVSYEKGVFDSYSSSQSALVV
jgi:hypothetical protein